MYRNEHKTEPGEAISKEGDAGLHYNTAWVLEGNLIFIRTEAKSRRHNKHVMPWSPCEIYIDQASSSFRVQDSCRSKSLPPTGWTDVFLPALSVSRATCVQVRVIFLYSYGLQLNYCTASFVQDQWHLLGLWVGDSSRLYRCV